MHNRAKSTRNQRPSAEEQQRQHARTAKYKAAYHKVVAAYQAGQYTVELLGHTAILIGINPDSYSLWNYRRNVLYYLLTGEHPPHPAATTPTNEQHTHTADVTTAAPSATPAPTSASSYTHDWSIDLTLTERSFHKNPKCYSAWYHRIWCIDVGQLNVMHELQVCDQMLKLDERNFHAWKHRRAIAVRVDRIHMHQFADQPPTQPSVQHVQQHYFTTPKQYITDTYHSPSLIDSEFQFTRQCINTNFSNFSAWHYRSQLLDMVIQQQQRQDGQLSSNAADSASKTSSIVTTPYLHLLDTEFELIKQALITQPSDQSPWLYYKWLIGKVMLAAGQQHVPNVGILTVDHSAVKDEAANTYDMPALDHVVSVLWRENGLCEQILKLEPEAKYAILTRFQILSALQHYEWITAAAPSTDAGLARLKHESAYVAMMQLETYDPFRAQYYDVILDRAEASHLISEPSLDAHFRQFCDAWQSLTHHTADQSQTLAIQIQHCYNDTHRKYHSWQHITHCLGLVQQAVGAGMKLSAGELNELIIALWFHDVVYRPLAKDNERRSAELFQMSCVQHQPTPAQLLDKAAVDRISHLINITAGHHVTAHALLAEQLMCDVDLAILGAPEAEFDEYDRNVRAEYSMVPAEAYRIGRARVLQTFLDRPSIYCTEWAKQQFEQPAKRNLQRAIDKLQSG